MAKANGAPRALRVQARELLNPRVRNLLPGNAGVKAFSVAKAQAAVGTGGTITKLTAIAQGSAANQRIGDEANVLAIDWRFFSEGGSINCERVIIFQWNFDDGVTAPTLALVLANPGVAADIPKCAYNPDSIREGSLKVIFDSLYVTTSAVSKAIHEEMAPNTRIRFNSGATTGVGHYYVLECADANTPGSGFVSNVIFDQS